MNKEQTREAAQVMLAWADRKEVQHRIKKCDSRSVLKPDWCDTDAPWWDFDSYEYRIKPTAKLRPWTADEVPLGAQVRSKSYHPDHRSLITTSGNSIHREGWLNGYEHSTDGGKTWLPCGVVEEAKP